MEQFMTEAVRTPSISDAAPFWLSLTMVPVAVSSVIFGGIWVLALPIWAWGLFTILDAISGEDESNIDPLTEDSRLTWYRLVTVIWFPVQLLMTYGLIWYVTRTDHLGLAEQIGLFFGVGVVAGTIGIVYAHELMHQKSKTERLLGDFLMCITIYGHFRSEHLLVHHRYVGTPKDPVTARYNEGFHRFYPRVLWQSLVSSFNAEAAMLARKNKPWFHRSNPFWRYILLESGFAILAFIVGGWAGVGLFLVQAGIAIWQLELVNYIEHYGLTRKHLGGGKYEHVLPRHSWNSNHKASNWLLINLQRHSDHHYKPDRRFPLLQAHTEDSAPQLPHGYPVMTAMAMVPPIWRRVMNPKVRQWLKKYYPEIEDWGPYKTASLPMPR
jgi:alkane 1-monooxygenase